ncbi:hypothetical protein [Hydrogenophaga sp.]|uniref:hypothetical protein n=1 Tax=Hydrogenophaga sp. TaxID=1904254 RepID=UPI003561BE14
MANKNGEVAAGWAVGRPGMGRMPAQDSTHAIPALQGLPVATAVGPSTQQPCTAAMASASVVSMASIDAPTPLLFIGQGRSNARAPATP